MRCSKFITAITLPEEGEQLFHEGVIQSIHLLLLTAQPPATSLPTVEFIAESCFLNSCFIVVIRWARLLSGQIEGGYSLGVPA